MRRLRARGETVASLKIRDATAADIPPLARLHVTTWNATYAPLLITGPSYEIRERQWREAFAQLLREYQRVGLGRRLLGHVARRFLSQGISSMWLFGDARNPSSRAWTALSAEKTDHDPGTGNYGWRDLRNLARLPD